MKKTLLYIVFGVIISLIVMPKAHAASMSVSANKTTVTVGSSVTITVGASSVAGQFSVSSSNSSVLNGGGSKWIENGSESFTFSAKKIGSATITATASNASTVETFPKDFTGSKSVTINVVAKSSSSSSSNGSSNKSSSSVKNTSNKNDSKSADNNLKSLSVEGQTIEFNKDTTNYNLSVGNDVKKIKINAEASDSKATITGTGEKDVKEGDNKFDIVVTAENGDKKTYTINVNVDTEPITVTVLGKKYTLVKKKEELPELSFEHEDLTLNFDGQDIPAYRIDKINFVLVGLRDEEGNIKLYKYDSYKDGEKPDEYTLFIPITLPQMLVSYLDFPKDLIPEGFKKYKEEINGEKVNVYKLSKDSDYCLFYGVNMETGEKNIYKYDSKEKTFQIYDREELKLLEKQMQEYKYVIVGLIGFSALLLIIIVIIFATRKGRFIKKIQKIQNRKMAQL